MTDIERKALALVDEVKAERNGEVASFYDATKALCRAIEQHEAFRQEVSDAVGRAIDDCGHDGMRKAHISSRLDRFIIPKPDPLVEALTDISGEGGFDNYDHMARRLYHAPAAHGMENITNI